MRQNMQVPRFKLLPLAFCDNSIQLSKVRDVDSIMLPAHFDDVTNDNYITIDESKLGQSSTGTA